MLRREAAGATTALPPRHFPEITMSQMTRTEARARLDEAVGYLQDLLRIDTTNPPGNETRAAEYLAGVLRHEGYEPLVIESSPGRGNVVVRYTGSGRRRPLLPLLLYGHTDVVAAEDEHWTHGPFSGD